MTDSSSTSSSEHVSPRLGAALDQLAEGVIITDEQGEIVYINSAAAAIHGIRKLGVGPTEYARSYRLFTMDGEAYPSEELPLARASLKGETVENAYWRISRDDGVEIVASGTARPVLNGEGKQIGAVLTLRDETERETEREELRKTVEVKDLLLREIHHRVKNNLQIVSSLLNLQSRRSVDSAAKEALTDLSARVDVISDIHRALYEAGETDSIEMASYLANLARRHFAPLARSFGMPLNVQEQGQCVLPIEKATSVALALNELILTTLQSAIRDGGRPTISLEIAAKHPTLIIGYVVHGTNSFDRFGRENAASSFEHLLVKGLEKQLSATVENRATDDSYGVVITIPFEGNKVAAA